MDSTVAGPPRANVTLAEQLDRIAERVGLMATLLVSLRDENQRLQGALERSTLENRQLQERVEQARERVERLLERLPVA